jgi:two-component system, cell cycle sensor histidine kinase and response regulator CckA
MSSTTLDALLVAHVPDAAYLHDESGKIVDVNEQACKMLGYARDELIATNMSMINVVDRPSGIWSALNESGFVEGRHRRKDGRVIPVEIMITSTKARGRKLQVVTARDISHRKQTDEALRRSEQKLRAVIGCSPIILFAFDRTGVMTLSEGQGLKAIRHKPGEIVGKSFIEVFKEAPQMLSCCRRALRGEAFSDTCDLRGLTYDCHFSPMVDGDGHFNGVIAVASDITVRRHAEEALRQNETHLRQAQKMEAVGRLAGGVAHDFNNILTAIIGYGEMLLKSLEPGTILAEHCSKILHASNRASALTRQLLAFSRKQVVTPRVFDLNVVVSEANQLLRRLIGEDIDLLFIPDPALGSVKADRSQIEQVIMNLAVNAREAMPRGGRLVIETSNVMIDENEAKLQDGAHSGAHVMLQVTDTGIGMDKHVLAHLFEPFFTTKEQGTGLGLSTVYGIVKQNGGHIQVFSSPAKGAIFRIYLPRVDTANDESRVVPIIEGSGRGSETILLAEDEEAVRSLAVDALRSHGYTVLEARDGVEAVAVAKRHKGSIHLLVTDMVMPKVSGRELAEQLAAVRPDLRVLYISGYTNDTRAAQGIPEENTEFLHKPFSITTLVHTVRSILDGREVKR